MSLPTLNRKNFPGRSHPTRIVQFGEGNFLRAFVDWQIDRLNEHTDLNAGIAVIRPIDFDGLPLLNEQEGLYTTIIRGLDESGEKVSSYRVIRSVNSEIPVYRNFADYMNLAKEPELRFVFSNTTEAGIDFCESDLLTDCPASSFPAKLTQWLYKRFRYFSGASDKGLIIIPCELIDYNGEKLKEIVLRYCELWQLEQAFSQWLKEANTFCSTLVDRIVTGHPREEHQALQQEAGYADQFMVTAEHFYLFVIQGPESLKNELRLDQLPLNIKVVDDIRPYRERKVAILNGAHTTMVPLAYLSGLGTVGEALNDELLAGYVETLMFREIVPALDLPEDELESFARDVLQRFRNPYIKHQLISISLNSMTKFATRILPQLLRRVKDTGQVPVLMSMAFAAQCLFYRGGRGSEQIALQDSEFWLDTFSTLWHQHEQKEIGLTELVSEVLGVHSHWGQDLNQIEGLTEQIAKQLEAMMETGVRDVIGTQLAELS